jgi:isopropylmalate/homocitrate/citramalate synthase
MTTTNRLTIFDTTLRDGEQAPGFSLRIDEKLKMAQQLSALGVDVIEAGFPITSEADAEAVRLVSTNVQGPVIAALARCHPADIDRAGWALSPAPRRRIHTFIATSDLHLERKLRMSKEMHAIRMHRSRPAMIGTLPRSWIHRCQPRRRPNCRSRHAHRADYPRHSVGVQR